MKITKSKIKDLMIYLIGFGVFIGICFPFFLLIFKLERSTILSPLFIFSCIAAGAIVGIVNVFIILKTLINRIKKMTDKMDLIKKNVISVAQGNTDTRCDLDVCQIKVDSDDVIGLNSIAYNELVETLALTMSSEHLVKHLDKEKITKRALIQSMETTKSGSGCILIEEKGELSIAYSQGFKQVDTLKYNDSIIAVANYGERKIISLPDDIVMDGIITTIKPKEIIIEPLVFNETHIGVMLLATTGIYTEKQKDYLGIISKTIGLALHNAISHEQIQKLAAIDPLTNTYNRRFGLSRLSDEFNRSIRMNTPLGVIMLDIDHFKNVNDTYGHLAGDKVLVTLSRVLKQSLRDGDVLLRYGGEEFLVLLPGASLENTITLSDKIRRITEEQVTPYGNTQIHVTISMGITSLPDIEYMNETELLAAVDEALYTSKQNGRNQVTIAKQG